ncbi:hypothetical protein, partial [Pseudomonas amygdali]|uniref:hypothetical protein n=1 Tax=Pseudomonas amygdali TaxID=47877 RepID=UPI001F2B82A6
FLQRLLSYYLQWTGVSRFYNWHWYNGFYSGYQRSCFQNSRTFSGPVNRNASLFCNNESVWLALRLLHVWLVFLYIGYMSVGASGHLNNYRLPV